MRILLLPLLLVLTSCNITITMVHTEGTATDVVDAESDAKADISPDVNVAPMGKIP